MEEVKAQDLISIARNSIDAFNAADWEKMRTFWKPEAKYYEPATSRVIEGVDDMVELWKGWKTAFPDLTGEVTNIFATDDHVFLEVTWNGTHTGPLVTPFGEFAATYKPYTSRAAKMPCVDDHTVSFPSFICAVAAWGSMGAWATYPFWKVLSSTRPAAARAASTSPRTALT